MTNMRRMLPAPSLRMSEGGMFDSLKRAVGVGPKETMREKYAREDAALKAKMAARAPAPAAAPEAPRAISDYVGNSALQRREKAAGLRDGGDLGTSVKDYARSIGPAWSQSNADFEATNPGMGGRVLRAVNPLTGVGSALGKLHDNVSEGDFPGAAMSAMSAVPMLAATKLNRTLMSGTQRVAKTAPTVGAYAGGAVSGSATDAYRAPPATRAAAAGLRNGGDLRTGAGGHVPGSGSGDKIPAKYEPGEFVVSNDMLDAAPELREQLHGLRGQVLAEKGMTPEQADAKALRGTGLRAAEGFGEEERKRTAFPTDVPPPGKMYGGLGMPTPAVETPSKRTAMPTQVPERSIYASQGNPVTEFSNAVFEATGGAGRPGAQVDAERRASMPLTPLPQSAQPVSTAAPSAQAAAAPKNTAFPSNPPVRSIYASQGNPITEFSNALTEATGGPGVAAGALRNGAAGMFPGSRAVGTGFADDISTAMKEPTMAGKIGKSLNAAGRAVPAAGLALIEDVVEPWTRLAQPVTTGAVEAAKTAVTNEPPIDIGNEGRRTSLRNPEVMGPPDSAKMPAASTEPFDPRTPRRIDGGSSPLFTNMPDDGLEGNDNLMNRRPMSAQNQGALDNMQANQDAGDQARLQKYQYDQEVARAQAINAAEAARGPGTGGFGLLSKEYQEERNLRLAGDSRGLRELRAQRADAARSGADNAAKEEIAGRTNTTTLRGQDMDYAGTELTAGASDRKSLRDAQIAERTYQTGRADRAQDQEGKVFERAQTARKNFTERANTMFPGKDGKPDAKKVAEYTTFTTRALGEQSKKMLASKDPAVRAAGAQLAKGDMSLLDSTDIERIDRLFRLDQATKDSGGGPRQSASGSSEVVGRADAWYQRRVKLADGRVVPESDITGAGWLNNGDESDIPEPLRMR